MARMRRFFPRIAAAVFVLGLCSPAVAKGPRISTADRPSMKEGSPAVVLVELSDFECPYCGLSAREVMPQVQEKLVRVGKVEVVYLNLPLQIHSHAFQAAQAASCAGDQKKFWEMHDLLFAHQHELAQEQLSGYAGEAGLDLPAFQKCLASGRHDGEIRQNIRTAQILGISGTPAYVLGRRSPGSDKVEVEEVIKGVLPYEELEKKVNALLAAK